MNKEAMVYNLCFFLFISFSDAFTASFYSPAQTIPLRPRGFCPPSSFLRLRTAAGAAAADEAQVVEIRDWVPGEGEVILDLLRTAQGDGKFTFNPEGSLSLDCANEDLLKESYDPEDGGSFVVAEAELDDDTTTIVGVAGLIVGTPVEYQASGASVSSAETTAAIRRCCFCSASINDFSAGSRILTQLLTTLEERAMLAQATQLIALAYPTPFSKGTISRNNNDNDMVLQPTPQLLEQLGYQKLPQQLPGVEAMQYGKALQNRKVSSITTKQANTISANNSNNAEEETTSNLAGSAIAIGALGFLLGGFISVAQFIGFDTTVASDNFFSSPTTPDMDQINRGLGRPLSSEDLGQLLQDEKLQRKTLDAAANSGGGREWKDLSLEEQREEMALLQIINGQDVRIK
uniref:Uncharacterized protein n=2 Tax=Ditylum brightwellii TaxID=49249 RepID=A0A7S1YU63_9STRA|mmetsp:Transcript_17566/g.26173  ORF Transcript_17566/g.26173 Transcript_17566/m.26173 type:complete len:404 (+) Transcript_17566:47-1258(+)